MNEEELKRKRKIARERIGHQFSAVIEETGCIIVDCGELGHAVVTPQSIGFDVRWLRQAQVRTLQGRIE